MNLCFVSQEYPEETGWGGIGTYTREIAHGLARLGHRVVVLSRALERERRYTETDGVEVYRILPSLRLGGVPLLWRLNRLAEGYHLAVAQALPSILRRHAVDLIETPDIHAEALLFKLLRPKSPPLVVRLHSNERYGVEGVRTRAAGGGRLAGLAERAQLRLAAAISSPTAAAARLRDPGFELPARKLLAVIPNPVDTSLFKPDSQARDAGGEGTEVLCVGRFVPTKGMDVLLQAAPAIADAAPGARFSFVGLGMGRWASEADAAGLPRPARFAERVRFSPQVPRAELPAVYARAAVCVVPSRWETFGYTCAEAMACGKAVVASRIEPLAELVEHGASGLLVDPGRPGPLAEAVASVLLDRGLRRRLGQAARRRVEALCDPRAAAARTADFYRRVLSRA